MTDYAALLAQPISHRLAPGQTEVDTVADFIAYQSRKRTNSLSFADADDLAQAAHEALIAASQQADFHISHVPHTVRAAINAELSACRPSRIPDRQYRAYKSAMEKANGDREAAWKILEQDRSAMGARVSRKVFDGIDRTVQGTADITETDAAIASHEDSVIDGAAIEAALGACDEHECWIIRAYYLSGLDLSDRQIAEHLGISRQKAQRTREAALKKLAGLLSN